MSKNLFSYLLKNKKILVIFLSVMCITLMMTPYINGMDRDDYTVSWVIGYVFLFGTCYFLPAYLFRFLHSKKACDSYFSLPVSRRELMNTNLLFSGLVSFCPYLAGAVLSALVSMTGTHVDAGSLLKALTAGLITVIVLTLVNALFYSLANTLFDGLVMIAAYTAAPLMVYMLLGVFMNMHIAGMRYWSGFTDFVRILSPAWLSGELFASFSVSHCVILLLYAAAAYWLLSKQFVERRTERAEQVSDQFFAYPFMIGFYAFAILCCISFSWSRGTGFLHFLQDAFIFYILLLFIFIIANFVYKRKIRLEGKTLLFYGVSILLTLLIAFAANSTQGFGISRLYEHNPRNVHYEYSVPADRALLEEMQIKDDGYSQVEFQITIPEAKMNDPEYREIIRLLEGIREQAIDDYYSDKDFMNCGRLMIRNNFAEGPDNIPTYVYASDHSYDYGVVTYLSSGELKTISRTVPVMIYTSEGEYTLSAD